MSETFHNERCGVLMLGSKASNALSPKLYLRLWTRNNIQTRSVPYPEQYTHLHLKKKKVALSTGECSKANVSRGPSTGWSEMLH